MGHRVTRCLSVCSTHTSVPHEECYSFPQLYQPCIKSPLHYKTEGPAASVPYDCASPFYYSWKALVFTSEGAIHIPRKWELLLKRTQSGNSSSSIAPSLAPPLSGFKVCYGDVNRWYVRAPNSSGEHSSSARAKSPWLPQSSSNCPFSVYICLEKKPLVCLQGAWRRVKKLGNEC